MLGGSQYHVDHFLDPISITFSSSSSSSSSSTIITAASHELDYQQYLLLLLKLQWSPTNSTITTTTTSSSSSSSNSSSNSSSKLLRSLLMDVGLSMDAPPPNHLSNAYMNFYLDTTAATTTTTATTSAGGGGGDSLQDAAAAALYGAPAPPPAPLLPPQLILGLHTNATEAANEEDEMHKLMIQQQMQVLHHQHHHHRHHHHRHHQHHTQLEHTQLQNQLQQQQQHNFMKRKSGPLPPSLPVPVPVPLPPPSLQQHHQPPRRMQQQHSTVISSSSSNNNNYSTGGAMLCGRTDTHLLPPGGGGVDDCPAAVLMQLGGGGGNNNNNNNNTGGGGGGGGSLHQVKSSGMEMAMAMAMAAATVTPPPPPPPSSSSSSSSSSSPWLDPRLWSRLPEALVQRVLASLPLPSFFRSRLVCKRWYSLLFSDSFLELSASVRATARAAAAAAQSSRWFLLFRKGVWTEAMAFDPGAKAWHRLDLSFLPPRFGVVASAGGLLCCISEERGRKSVLICNPLTRAYVRLPPGLTERLEPTVGLAVDPHTKAYRVLAAGDDLISPFAVKNLTTEIYDSRLQQWSMTAPLPRLCNLESGKTTFANGFFYCMNYSPFSVLAYDTHSRAWSKIQAPMRRFLRTPNLVDCRGRLVLVAAVEKNKLNVPKSIRIWGLQASRTSWTELERMPHALYEEFTRVSGHRAFHCIGHGNQILITLPGSPDMLLYDFYEKVWRWAARCPFALNPVSGPDMPSNSQPAPFHAFAYDPRLEALVC